MKFSMTRFAITASISASLVQPLLVNQSLAQTYGDFGSEPPARSLTQAPATPRNGSLHEQRIAASAEAGAISYGTPTNGTQVRGVLGIGFNWNAVTAFTAPEERTDAWSRI